MSSKNDNDPYSIKIMAKIGNRGEYALKLEPMDDNYAAVYDSQTLIEDVYTLVQGVAREFEQRGIFPKSELSHGNYEGVEAKKRRYAQIDLLRFLLEPNSLLVPGILNRPISAEVREYLTSILEDLSGLAKADDSKKRKKTLEQARQSREKK